MVSPKSFKTYNRSTRVTIEELARNCLKITVSDPQILERLPYSDLLSESKIYLLPKTHYSKLKRIFGDTAMSLEEFEKMIDDLTIVTDGEKFYSLSESPRLRIANTPIELSKAVYEKYECLTLVHAPWPPYPPLSERLAEDDAYTDSTSKRLREISLLCFDKRVGYVFMEIIARHTRSRLVSLRELLRNNEKFIATLAEKYGVLNTMVCFKENFYNITLQNDYFPIHLLNPENPEQKRLLILHNLGRRNPMYLLLYQCPDKLPRNHLIELLSILKGSDPSLISLMPEEVQIAALTLL